jgi:hypothetical protein
MSRSTIASSEIASHVKKVLGVIGGGRVYTSEISKVPMEIRLLSMRDRVGKASGKTLNDAALRASAISNYYNDIGDRPLAKSWDAMAQDLSLVSGERMRWGTTETYLVPKAYLPRRKGQPALPPGTSKG